MVNVMRVADPRSMPLPVVRVEDLPDDLREAAMKRVRRRYRMECDGIEILPPADLFATRLYVDSSAEGVRRYPEEFGRVTKWRTAEIAVMFIAGIVAVNTLATMALTYLAVAGGKWEGRFPTLVYGAIALGLTFLVAVLWCGKHALKSRADALQRTIAERVEERSKITSAEAAQLAYAAGRIAEIDLNSISRKERRKMIRDPRDLTEEAARLRLAILRTDIDSPGHADLAQLRGQLARLQSRAESSGLLVGERK